MPVDGAVLHLRAPAKVNLSLRVFGRRPDGYHELETWMQKLDLYDTINLQLRRHGGITLKCSDVDVPADETNLAWRAATAFLAASRRAAGIGVDITLHKHIPTAAGLGGGSSDAGTVLRGLNSLFDSEMSEQELIALARPIGADVPFFATAYSAVLATGIGDIMQPVEPLDRYTFILINPGFSVATRWVFEAFALTGQVKEYTLAGFRKNDFGSLSLKAMINDLELVTSEKYPEIERMKKQLLDAGAAEAMMSGSGPTVFGVFPDSNESNQVDILGVAEMLRQEYKDKVFVTRACVGA